MSISALDKVRDRNIPLNALIELTHRCNLRCCHCYLPKQREEHELTAAEFKRILDEIADAGTLFLIFSGGEVLLRDDFFEIAAYARKRHFSIRIFTNGTLVSEELADEIKDLSPYAVEISVYGKDSKTHDSITKVSGSFHKSIGAIKLLKQRGIEVVMKTPLMTQNVAQYKEIISMANRLEVKYELNTVISPGLDGSCEPLSYRIGELELSEIFSDTSLNPDIIEKHKVIDAPGKREDIPMCAAGRSAFVVSPVGEISPCAVLRVTFGDVKKQPFSEIWHSPAAGKIRATKFTDLRTCSQCELSAYCTRCPGMALIEDGDLLGPARFCCEMARVSKSIHERNTPGRKVSTEYKKLETG